MPVIVCNASSRATCLRKPNSIQNVSVLTHFVSGVLNSLSNYKLRKLPVNLEDAEYLSVAGLQFREEFLLWQLKCNLLVGGQDRAYSFLNARNRKDAA
jgi:hypothetical protein